jgi:hypothetical protein
MATRLWTALLMLAAVFAMHGLQCTSAADGTHSAGAVQAAASPMGAAPGAPVEMAFALTADGHTSGAASGLTDSMPEGSAAAVPFAATTADAGHPGTPHESAGHLWTLCLAVLAAGIAVLLALLAPRLVGPAASALRRARASDSRWLAPARPPDLSALCLLRI